MQSNAVICFKAGPRSISLLPFLYQTRTLAPLYHHQPSFRRAQSSEAASPSRSDSQAPSFNISRIDPIYGQSEREYAEEVASYPTAAEWTRAQSNFRPPSLKKSELPPHTFTKSNIDQYDTVAISDEGVSDALNHFGESHPQGEYNINSYRPGAQPKNSTITESEKEAFNRIFSDIFNKQKSKNEKIDPMQNDISYLNPRVGQARETTANLMNQAVRDVTGKSGRQPVSFKSRKGDPLDVEKRVRVEIEKYPPSLRSSASRALASVARRDVLDSTISSSAFQEQLDEVNDLEHLREPERQRVEQLMRAAKTDFELWQVMEEEVFSIISELGLKYGEGGDQTSLSEKAAVQDLTTPTQETAASTNEYLSNVSQLEVLGPLYPSYLLLGIRILSTTFTHPSALALSILPHVKSLGVISQVLGASTSLYNEILRIQWLRYSNYTAVLELLTEMENSGLDFDHGTLEVVQGIQRMRDRVGRGEQGEIVKALLETRFVGLERLLWGWERRIRREVGERDREFERRLTWAQ